MKTLTGRTDNRIARLLVLSLSFFLFVPLSQAADAQKKPADLKQDFLKMFARAYYPGRSGQIMLVPQQGEILTRTNAPLVSFMHGSPWDYDRNIPLLFFGPPFVRQGSYSRATIQQDIVPTLAALLKLPLPSTVSGRPLSEAVNPTAGRPRTILLIVLDGMRQDYFERHSAVLPTLTRLRHEGAWFNNTRVNFLPTVTTLGHASIGTGTDPRVHGIVLNSFFDRLNAKSQNPYGSNAPNTLMALTLADIWNLKTDGQAAIIVQGGSFEAAAGLGGHGACLFNARPIILTSYSGDGSWETNSSCYKLPEYLKNQKSRQLWESVQGKWMGHDIANPVGVSRSALFPKFQADALISTIENEPVGTGEFTSLVFANMKAPDYVGHQYGPDSAELEATLAEQDRQVARVIQALEKKVGANQFLAVITADHGMPSEPQAPRKRYFDKDFIELVNKKFDPERNAVVANFDAANTQVFINKARLRELGLSLSQIKEFLEAQPFIFAAYTEDEIERAASLP